MKVGDTAYRTIWTKKDEPSTIQIIDQRFLPHYFVIENLHTVDEVAAAIRDMHVRGAPLIGVAAAYGMYLAALHAAEKTFDEDIFSAYQKLKATRPTAINLEWGLQRQMAEMQKAKTVKEKVRQAFETAQKIADEDAAVCQRIGEHGLALIESISRKKKGETVHILTHCNAGWLACVDWGTATSPIYHAHNKGISVHVWVDETRPRNQGASLTAWELGQHGVPHTVIVDNCGGHLMQHGKVDMAIVGTDRTTRTGDVANKIGTYLKALAALDNKIPFYVAVPSSSIDWRLRDGVREIPIEERTPDEVKFIEGFVDGHTEKVLVTPASSPALNYGFDVTPARLVTGLISERGVCQANEDSLLRLYPEQRFVAASREEGVVKFSCEWQRTSPIESPQFHDLNHWRNELHTLGLIGQYEDGIGFGNISVRMADNDKHFLITGTQTGGVEVLSPAHYTLVTGWDISNNKVVCQGPIKASSESLTHAMIYELSPEIGAVIHVHYRTLWKELLGRVPTTDPSVPYGSPEMAREVKRLYQASSELRGKKILVMGGHEEGIMSFGRDLEEAADSLFVHLKQLEIEP